VSFDRGSAARARCLGVAGLSFGASLSRSACSAEPQGRRRCSAASRVPSRAIERSEVSMLRSLNRPSARTLWPKPDRRPKVRRKRFVSKTVPPNSSPGTRCAAEVVGARRSKSRLGHVSYPLPSRSAAAGPARRVRPRTRASPGSASPSLADHSVRGDETRPRAPLEGRPRRDVPRQRPFGMVAATQGRFVVST
jgi:hypothetical protein